MSPLLGNIDTYLYIYVLYNNLSNLFSESHMLHLNTKVVFLYTQKVLAICSNLNVKSSLFAVKVHFTNALFLNTIFIN